jgi:NAD(P)-dependent dehydrogenase (short-subunit alcohol dehydrogenase family)
MVSPLRAVSVSVVTRSGDSGSDRIWTPQVDVTDKSTPDAVLSDFRGGNADGGLDTMWNNAGIGQSGWFEDVPYETAMRAVDVNFEAVLTGGVRVAAVPEEEHGTAWAAYHDQKPLHWYVPASIGWIDRIKGISAELVRDRIVKVRPGRAD